MGGMCRFCLTARRKARMIVAPHQGTYPIHIMANNLSGICDLTECNSSSRVKCPLCPTLFSGDYMLGNLKRHLKSSHSSIRCVCKECGKEFKRSDARRTHYRKEHPELL